MPDTDRHDPLELHHEQSTFRREVDRSATRRLSSFELHAMARKARAQAQRDWVLACVRWIMTPASHTRDSGVQTPFSIDPHR